MKDMAIGSKPRLNKESSLGQDKIVRESVTSLSSCQLPGLHPQLGIRWRFHDLKGFRQEKYRNQILEDIKLLASCLVQCHVGCAISSWYWGLNEGLKNF